ncbi:MAG: DUF3800 domain-containing protein [Clostridiales Family XIII bacterium]|jgi:hypothetical protein|nr:DUF3800 domain-containing protein [Clostridiales Family XIII bacterium]
MVSIFFDESGDLGWGDKSSKFFVLAFLITDEPKKIEAAMKKTVSSMTKKQRKKIHGYMHAVDIEPSVVRTCLKRIDKTGAKIAIYAVDKSLLSRQKDKHVVYNELVAEFLDKLALSDNVEFLASRREKAKRYNDKFIATILDGRDGVTADTAYSWTDRRLQAVDFVAWAFGAKYENGDSSFVDCLSQIEIIELTNKTKPISALE